MPFKSDKQRRYLYSQKPAVAAKFARHSNRKATRSSRRGSRR